MSKEKHPNPQLVLRESKTVAIVGCSADPYRTSNYAAHYLQKKGYRVIPVNPRETEILGEPCYARLAMIPEDITIDIVNIFRNKRYTEGVVDEVIDWKNNMGQSPVIWTQLDVSSNEAALKAEQAALPYIRNVCIMVELDHLK